MLLKTNCSLPFELGQTIEEPFCQTYREGVEVVKEILASRKKCKSSCLQIDVRYKEEPDHYLLALATRDFVKTFADYGGDSFGYHYIVPDKITLLSNVHEYTATVALGYFGSIVGVFIGVSILGMLEIIADTLNLNQQVTKWILNTAKLVMIIYLLVIFGMLLFKYIHKPVANSISFDKTNSDLSLSVCSISYYSYRNIQNSYNCTEYRYNQTHKYKYTYEQTDYYSELDSNFQLRNITF